MPQEHPRQEPNSIRRPSLMRVFGLCFLAVAVLFMSYEIVERTWLGEIDPKKIHFLHILRGLAASAIAGAVAALVLLRTHYYGQSPEAALPLPRRTWQRRLQHFRMRTKIVIPMVVLAVVPPLFVGLFTIARSRASLRDSAIERVKFDAASRARSVRGFLLGVQKDVRFLATMPAIRNLARAEAARASDEFVLSRSIAERELLIFAQGKIAYYQVRYLDSAGREVVRLNIDKGQAKVVPLSRLQDKSDRYYVTEALAMGPGPIYVSRMDLNIEHGEVELPPRGVVRYATVVSGTNGRGRGLVVINLYAEAILSLLAPLPSGSEAWLVDREGAYLGYVGESEEKRSLYRLGNQRRLSVDYSREDVVSILSHEPRDSLIETAAALVSFAPITLDDASSQRRWNLLIAYPRAPIEAPIRHLTVFLLVVLVFVVVVAGVLGVLVGSYLARPIVSLRRATREIAAGDLSKHVRVTTGDELEGLAGDFNLMTERLRDAQERLSRWNEELQREVGRQTNELHQLQSVLARADKMASIGQMTAGVMHEVGNPLAAIKTKIQVAQVDKGFCRDSEWLLSEILAEVDRLVVFLRSFSRLAKRREPQMQQVFLADVIHGVVALVNPELGQRGLGLDVKLAADVPAIRGDPGQLRQLLINLILNAAEASTGGTEILVGLRRIASSAQTAGSRDRAGIEVVDRGSGMPKEVLERIWDPFFTTKPEGTGLGLSICRQIVTDHGGTIRVQSTRENGTVVRMTFPEWTADGSESAGGGPHPTPSEPPLEHQP